MKSRREFLGQIAALGALPQSLAWAANDWGQPAENLLVLVYLKGGNDAFNTFVPLDDKAYRTLRPTLAIPRDQLIPFSATHGFNIALKPLLPAWESREIALIQGIGQEDVTNQHYRDLETQFTGAAPNEYLAQGWITRALSGGSSPESLDALTFGDLDIRVADPFGPFRGEQLKVVNIVHPAEWRNPPDCGNVACCDTAFKASLPLGSGPHLYDQVPRPVIRDALRSTAELREDWAGAASVRITLNAHSGDHHDAFDTHWDQARYHGAALTKLADGLAAFRTAMIEAGLWQRTLVATYDEFGRSPRENERAGTHHGCASTYMVLARRGGRSNPPFCGPFNQRTRACHRHSRALFNRH